MCIVSPRGIILIERLGGVYCCVTVCESDPPLHVQETQITTLYCVQCAWDGGATIIASCVRISAAN